MSVKLRTPYVLTLLEVGAPPIEEPGVVKLYGSDTGGGSIELFIRGADGNESQLTDSGLVAASALLNATGSVSIGSAAPSVGQTLIATSTTTATWQNAGSLELTSTAPVAIDAGPAQPGDSTEAAKGNHKHSVLTGTPSALVVGGSNAPGTLDSLARADHLHGLPGFGATAGTFGQGNDARFTDDRTASGIRTTTGIVNVSSAVAPSAGTVLTATSATAANWQTLSGGGAGRSGEGGPVSEFVTAPASPHPNDREFTTTPAGWGLYRVGIDVGSTDGVLVTPTVGDPNFGIGLSAGQSRLTVNPNEKRSWAVWDSFAENRAWFYGFRMIIGASHVFRARLSMINELSGTGATVPESLGGLLQLALITDNRAGLPGFQNGTGGPGVCFRMGWQSEAGTIKIKSEWQVNASSDLIKASADIAERSIPDCEFVMRIADDHAYFFARTAGQTLAFGEPPGLISEFGAAFLPGSPVWVGFMWNAMNTISPGGKMYSADYFRQQDDALFYG